MKVQVEVQHDVAAPLRTARSHCSGLSTSAVAAVGVVEGQVDLADVPAAPGARMRRVVDGRARLAERRRSASLACTSTSNVKLLPLVSLKSVRNVAVAVVRGSRRRWPRPMPCRPCASAPSGWSPSAAEAVHQRGHGRRARIRDRAGRGARNAEHRRRGPRPARCRSSSGRSRWCRCGCRSTRWCAPPGSPRCTSPWRRPGCEAMPLTEQLPPPGRL